MSFELSWIAIGGALLFFLGVLASVALHELGHMIPAKIFDVRVTQFFVGMGKTLWSRRKGETEYGVKLLPVAGFVRMVGMFPPNKQGQIRYSTTGAFRQLAEEARQASWEEVPEGEEHRMFYAKKWWQKLIIMVSGPAVNIVIAFFLFGVVLMGFGTYVPKLTVDNVSDCVIPASANRAKCTADDPPAPAKQAGFEKGDKLLAFNGKPVPDWEAMQDRIRDSGAGTVSVDVERDGRRMTLHPKLIASERQDPNNPAETSTVGFLGLGPVQVKERQGFGAVVTQMGDLTARTGQAMLGIPQRMVGVAKAAFGGDREQDSPMSMIGASRVAGEIATMDAPVNDRAASFVQWLAAVNLFLALFNFLPLLPLDGGHIVGALWEAIRRAIAKLRHKPDPGPVDMAKAMPLAYAVASVMIVMGALLLYADIVNPVRLN